MDERNIRHKASRQWPPSTPHRLRVRSTETAQIVVVSRLDRTTQARSIAVASGGGSDIEGGWGVASTRYALCDSRGPPKRVRHAPGLMYIAALLRYGDWQLRLVWVPRGRIQQSLPWCQDVPGRIPVPEFFASGIVYLPLWPFLPPCLSRNSIMSGRIKDLWKSGGNPMTPTHHAEIASRLDRLVQQAKVQLLETRQPKGPGRPSQGIRAGYVRTSSPSRILNAPLCHCTPRKSYPSQQILVLPSEPHCPRCMPPTGDKAPKIAFLPNTVRHSYCMLQMSLDTSGVNGSKSEFLTVVSQ
jgi:hypothetical protein